MKSIKGFTLTELLIAIAIIGILVSIAVPSLQSFSMRGKTGEAKLKLAELRNASITYMAEYQQPASCMFAMGVAAAPVRNYYASMIFHELGPAADNSGARAEGLASCLDGIEVDPARISTDPGTIITTSVEILAACNGCIPAMAAGEMTACVAGIIKAENNDLSGAVTGLEPSTYCWNNLTGVFTNHTVGY